MRRELTSTVTFTATSSIFIILLFASQLTFATASQTFSCKGETFTTKQVISVVEKNQVKFNEVSIDSCVYLAGLEILGDENVTASAAAIAETSSSISSSKPNVHIHNASFIGAAATNNKDDVAAALTIHSLQLLSIHVSETTIREGSFLQLSDLSVARTIMLDTKGGLLIPEIRSKHVYIAKQLRTDENDDVDDALSAPRGWRAGPFCPEDWESDGYKTNLKTDLIDDALSRKVPLWAIIFMGVMTLIALISLAVAINARQAAAERNVLQRQLSALLASNCAMKQPSSHSLDSTAISISEGNPLGSAEPAQHQTGSSGSSNDLLFVKSNSAASLNQITLPTPLTPRNAGSNNNHGHSSSGKAAAGTLGSMSTGTGGSGGRNGLSVVEDDDEDLEVHEL